MDALIKRQDKPRIVKQMLKVEYVPLHIVKADSKKTAHKDEAIKASDWLKSDEAAFWMGM